MRNISSLMIPYQYLTKVFLSHLHTDHWGGLSSLWAGGWTAGRPVPLEIWGPSGMTPDMGTKYAIEHFLNANNWDYQTRAYKITPVSGNITVREFDYKAENKVIYKENGITVRYATTLGPEERFTTVELKINFLKPVRNSKLRATGRVLTQNQTTGLTQCEIVDERDQLIAHATSTFIRSCVRAKKDVRE